MKQCAICDKFIENEEAPILTMGGFGNPRYLCDECADDLDIITDGADYETIAAAMERLGQRMSNFDPDSHTYKTVSVIMAKAAVRAKAIKEGTYDFSSDSEDEDSFDEIPEELRETEEDRELDRMDEEKQKKFDKIFDWVSLGAIIAAALFVLWRVLDSWVF